MDLEATDTALDVKQAAFFHWGLSTMRTR
jgi:hypothetical protein